MVKCSSVKKIVSKKLEFSLKPPRKWLQPTYIKHNKLSYRQPV